MEITEATVSGYYQFQLSRITEGANRNSCSKHMAIFNLFVDFCAQEVAAFKKPNNLRSRQYRLSQAGSDVAVFTNHEVSLLLRSCNSRMKLYMLLMLNCAMYQGDVASITVDDVDWENGRIIVARSKKEKLSDGPTVKCNWILWDETWKLLQDLGNRDGLVLTNVNGKPLLVNGIDKNGKPTKTDNIRTIFARLVTKLKNQGALPERWHKSLKHWRKTGCNIIEKSIDHAEFYALYLNHGTVAKRHYLVSGQPVPRFDAAVKWLGEQFGFKTTR